VGQPIPMPNPESGNRRSHQPHRPVEAGD
jgi:hypothetical protein